MTDYEIDIKEIKEILKKMQEDIKRLEKVNEQTIDTYNINNMYTEHYTPSTQACSEEELMKFIEHI